MKRIFLGSLLAAALAGSMAAIFSAFPARTASAQTSGPFPELDKNGKPVLPRPNPYLVYSPTDLGHNATTLPASGTTANTTIIKTAGVTKLTYFTNCTQSAKLTMNVYTADDKVNPQASDFTLFGSYDVVTSLPVSTGTQVYIASEFGTTFTGGSATSTISVRLPQVAISFSETNAGATPGTCTDRLVVGYN